MAAFDARAQVEEPWDRAAGSSAPVARRSRSYPQAPADVPKPVAHFTATVAKRGRRALVQNSPFGALLKRVWVG